MMIKFNEFHKHAFYVLAGSETPAQNGSETLDKAPSDSIEETTEGQGEEKKKKKKNKSKAAKSASKKQTDPPTIPIAELFPDGKSSI